MILFYKSCYNITASIYNENQIIYMNFKLSCFSWYCCDQKTQAVFAQSFTLWQQATMDITCHDHSIIACSHHIYTCGCYSSRTPVRGESHIQCNANREVATILIWFTWRHQPSIQNTHESTAQVYDQSVPKLQYFSHELPLNPKNVYIIIYPK